MKRSLPSTLFILLLSISGSLLLAACEETEETNEYANWQERNEAFIDSIAHVCDANADGKWVKYLSFKLNESDANGNVIDWDNANYVYCHHEVEGSGTISALFTDSVDCNYRGRLIPSLSYPEGYVFDQSFKGKVLDPEVNVPTTFDVGSLIVGWSTVMQYMHAGDTWRIYVPAELGYGSQSQESSGIPAYSALIFDVNVADIRHTGH